ncbi:MAG: RHS repeat-associated core domain-containing protein, partial [Phycisphaerales bacterium]
DLDGDLNYNEASELDAASTFTKANELATRDKDGDLTFEEDQVHDEVGNLLNDGFKQKYVYDVWGRLVEILNRNDDSILEEFEYNGLGYRTSWHYDVDGDTSVESNGDDPWFYFAYDENWRIVMTFQESDSAPKESFVYHSPGRRGMGASDRLVLRDKDANSSWGSSSDGTLEERVYYLANWRGDVVEVLDDAGNRMESVRYSSYGMPFAMPAGDTNNDGEGDSTDDGQFTTWIGASAYDVRGDMDLDGDVDATDQSTFNSSFNGDSLGFQALSGDADSELGNRRGYASYEHDGVTNKIAHVRHRVLLTDLGRWVQRDPEEYADGVAMYAYTAQSPIRYLDPSGLARCSIAYGPICDSDPCDGTMFGGPIGPIGMCDTIGPLQPCVDGYPLQTNGNSLYPEHRPCKRIRPSETEVVWGLSLSVSLIPILVDEFNILYTCDDHVLLSVQETCSSFFGPGCVTNYSLELRRVLNGQMPFESQPFIGHLQVNKLANFIGAPLSVRQTVGTLDFSRFQTDTAYAAMLTGFDQVENEPIRALTQFGDIEPRPGNYPVHTLGTVPLPSMSTSHQIHLASPGNPPTIGEVVCPSRP